MSARSAIVVLAAAAWLPLATPVAAASKPAAAAPQSIVVAQVPAVARPEQALADGTLRASLGDGGRLVLVSGTSAPRPLTAGFDSAADPEVSFDGRSILFAAKKAKGDPWCIWEMKVDGSGARKVTCGTAGARQPVYQSTIYTITTTNVEPWVQVAFVGVQPDQLDEAGVAPNTSLWTCKIDGTALRRVTFNLSNDLDPVILPDGRMVYAGWLRQTTAHGPQGRFALLGVNGDGTDYQTYAGDQGLRVKQMPAPTADGQVVFVEGDRIAADGAGRLAAVDQVRPLHSYRSLTAEEDGLFRAPSALPDGRLLVSWRPGQDASARTTAGIYRFDPATGAKEKVAGDPAWHSLQAKLVAARPMPDARSSVVREDDAEGKLYSIDVNINDMGDALPKGAAKSLRVVEGVPSPTSPPTRRSLGTVPLADDGSFQVQVPANTPVQLQLLDAQGTALRSSAWLWVRNHAAQGCVGCHEDPERTPPNRFVKALQAPAPVLNPPVEKRPAVSFDSDADSRFERHGAFHASSGGTAAHPGFISRIGDEMCMASHSTTRVSLPVDKRPAPDGIRAFVESIDRGGQP